MENATSVKPNEMDSSPVAARIGRFRWWICLMLFLVTVTNYIDRQAFSMVAPLVASAFHFSNSEIAIIVNAFLIAYTFGQFFSGAFMDWVGSRSGFSILVLIWSVASMITSLARGVLSFSFFRFLLGAAESGNFPGGIKVIAEWFPEEERSTAAGLFISGASIGAIVTPPCIAFLVVHFGWQLAFAFIGVPGLIWVLGWRLLYRPVSSNPKLSAIECAHIAQNRRDIQISKKAGLPHLFFLRHRMFWGVFLSRFVEEPASWFYLTWLPLYLKEVRGVSLMNIGFLLTIPFLTLDLGYMGGGWTASRLIERGWPLDLSRKTVMIVSAALMLSAIPAVFASSIAGFVVFVSIATFGHGGWAANIMTLPGDMVPHTVVGTLYGITAFGGGLSSILFMQLTGRLADIQRSFNVVFLIAGILPVIAGIIILAVTGKIELMRLPGSAEPPEVAHWPATS
ncbi:MAG: MFS transporter [Acidobacteria bacterium]|nr:MFS transporter [Acidobacteriota bacterium]MBV9482326.1 MFS transporter [Acidobacteriota bacterium]